MQATITVYYETGLTPSNCLDSASKLANYKSASFNGLFVKQDRSLLEVKIEATWNNIKDADYAKINNDCYYITGMSMINDNVCGLQLLQDYVTTIGISNVTIISGQCKRRCVTDDTLFKNTIPESFTPQNETSIDFGNIIKPGSSTTSFKNIVLSTVDLEDVTKNAVKYLAEGANEEFVLVPSLPPATDNTIYYMVIDGSTKPAKIPSTTAYNRDNKTVSMNISRIRSLGVESAIVASYSVPTDYIGGANEPSGRILSISGIEKNITSSFSGKWGTYKNNKVYTGQFTKYILGSLVTGETQEFKPEEIMDSDGALTWQLNSDPMYNGYPTCKPSKYHNNSSFWLGVVKGAQWLNSPIAYNTQSGDVLSGLTQAYGALANVPTKALLNVPGSGASMLPNIDLNTIASRNPLNLQGLNRVYNLGMGLIGTVGNFDITKPLSSIMGGVDSVKSFVENHATDLASHFTPPDIKFSVIPNLQSYVGNYFYEYRTRLSVNDMERFDNYLTQFGYAVDEPLTKACFTGRKHFNYVQATDVNINANCSLIMRQGFLAQLASGIRVWHTLPTASAMTDNPITEV